MFVSLLLFEARFNGVREEEQAVQSDTISTVGEAKWFPSVLTVGRAGTAVFLHLDPCGGFHSQFFISHELRRRQAITASRRCALCRTTRGENKLKQQPAIHCGKSTSLVSSSSAILPENGNSLETNLNNENLHYNQLFLFIEVSFLHVIQEDKICSKVTLQMGFVKLVLSIYF